MIIVRSQDRTKLICCVGFYVEDTNLKFGPDYRIQGIISTTGNVIHLGYYLTEDDAFTVLDNLELAGEKQEPFDMPPSGYVGL
jgi:hypothetical protein